MKENFFYKVYLKDYTNQANKLNETISWFNSIDIKPIKTSFICNLQNPFVKSFNNINQDLMLQLTTDNQFASGTLIIYIIFCLFVQ